MDRRGPKAGQSVVVPGIFVRHSIGQRNLGREAIACLALLPIARTTQIQYNQFVLHHAQIALPVKAVAGGILVSVFDHTACEPLGAFVPYAHQSGSTGRIHARIFFMDTRRKDLHELHIVLMGIAVEFEQNGAPVVAGCLRISRRHRIGLQVQIDLCGLASADPRRKVVLIGPGLGPWTPICAVIKPGPALRVDGIQAAIVPPHALGKTGLTVQFHVIVLLAEFCTVQAVVESVSGGQNMQRGKLGGAFQWNVHGRQMIQLNIGCVSERKSTRSVDVLHLDQVARGGALDHLEIKRGRKTRRPALIVDFDLH
ncbi:MAG: Uncharacterised protein [Flavobacteriia bacterium]|nr:MAG: Uncharacterised protein [Flavobacteriia bacterium]